MEIDYKPEILYAIDDTGRRTGVIQEITRDKAKKLNKDNYGIFHTVQQFLKGRRKEDLKRITRWAIDIDGNKEKQVELINNTPLEPTTIIETKNGYHLYWNAKDATIENYNAIVERRLCHHFNADRNAKDLSRILRTPGFYHCKDPNDKYLVLDIRHRPTQFRYTEAEMFCFFKPEPSRKTKRVRYNGQVKVQGDSFWNRANNIPCDEGLRILSGRTCVNGEYFTLKNNSNGTRQIYVNGKNSPSWLDHDGNIGSYSHGGPFIANWINYYYDDWKIVADILKDIFKIRG